MVEIAVTPSVQESLFAFSNDFSLFTSVLETLSVLQKRLFPLSSAATRATSFCSGKLSIRTGSGRSFRIARLPACLS
jgi:hypothetical protein